MKTSFNLKLFAALFMLSGLFVCCDDKEAPQPPKKEPTKKMRQWDDWVDPISHPPHVDTANRYEKG